MGKAQANPLDRRGRLAHARLHLIFTPAAVTEGRDPLEVLEQALPYVDVVQVRVKELGNPTATSPARETERWTRDVLGLVGEADSSALVIVNDRVDVAVALLAEASKGSTVGIDGVHVGQDDLPPAEVRKQIGPEALIGLSTHDARDLARAADEPVDYLGFGPVWATQTKGYEHSKGPEAAWIASTTAAPRPVFPIGGIDTTNVSELALLGRAAVSTAILAAKDPASAARELRQCLRDGQADHL